MRPTQNNVLAIGPSGSGKTYFFVDWIVKELIPFSEAKIVTNFPFGRVNEDHFKPPAYDGETFVDRMTARTGIDCSERIELIDVDVLERWRRGEGGPWDIETSGETYFLIDEIALYLHLDQKKDCVIDWRNHFGHARHYNCWNICITQTTQKLPRNVLYEFGERWCFSDTAPHDGAFGVSHGDWNTLLSKAFKREVGSTQCLVRLNEGGTYSQRKDAKPFEVARKTSGFELYNSFSATTTEHEGESRDKLWQRLSWGQLLRWFMGRNRWFMVKVVFAGMVCSLGLAVVAWLNLSFGASEPVAKKAFSVIKKGVGNEEKIELEFEEKRGREFIGRVGRFGFGVDGHRRLLVRAQGREGELVGSSLRAESARRERVTGSDRVSVSGDRH